MSSDSSKKTVDKIRSGVFQRGLSLAKIGIGAGAKWASMRATGAFQNEETKKNNNNKFLNDNVQKLASELGELKGSLMKVGQTLSVYGEHFLPDEVNMVLKTLQSDSAPLNFKAIDPIIESELGEKRNELSIESTSLASASIGQVHRATVKSTGQMLALKVQYPGVDSAVDSDLKSLRSILRMSQVIPKEFNMDPVFSEVRTMLKKELDYKQERETTEWFYEKLKGNPKVRVPKVFNEFSSSKILATEFVSGVRLDSPQVKALSQERRNRLGQIFYEYYLNELFVWKKVQTDPHFGNYKVQLSDEDGQDKLVLFDFGAVREVDDNFVIPYKNMVKALIDNDLDALWESSAQLGFIKPEDPQSLKDLFLDFCSLIVEPFDENGTSPYHLEDGVYDWGASDLPSRVFKKGKKLILSFKLRTPPQELVFLDRKLGGVFMTLQTLGVKSHWKPLLKSYLIEDVKSQF